ncbi:MAG TPA: hypothetical protein PKC43_11870 [Phycisphaerales bacterium]|nr:hypothetical protein [Phycisphaerales bacterium]HMP38128.1 hypothetical protein [Phycisphaerales bacterium]
MLELIAGPLVALALVADPPVAGATAEPPAASADGGAAAVPADDTLSRARLERMLADGDTLWIVQVFRRRPGDVLPFVDHYLESGLESIEKGGDVDAAREGYRTAVRFAELANQAFGEVIFTEYAASFASWGELEQQRFREGQRLYREARSKAKSSPEEAVALHRRSLALAEPLGDAWGVAMNQLAIADLCLGLERFQEGHDAALKAMEVFGRIQLRPSYVRALTTCAKLRQALGFPDQGTGQLRMALTALPAGAAPETRQEIVDALLAALERVGRKDEADRIRESERPRQ